MEKISRRSFFKLAGVAAASAAVQARAAAGSDPAAASAQPPGKPAAPQRTAYLFFTPDQAAFIEAATERLIPADEHGPGALAAGVPSYLDKQLAGAWGAGERLYRSGPWQPGAPTQGYQLPFTPAELFRNALRALDPDIRKDGKNPFVKLAPQQQDDYLRELQNGKRDLNGVPANVFFESLLALTIEGFFSDPVYGGNQDMAAWKMIGFPGAYANYYDLIDQHGVAYTRVPMSLADDGKGVIHVHSEIPAYGSGGEDRQHGH